MAPINNLEQRAAKKLAAAEGINYTEALRRIRSSGTKPSELLAGQQLSATGEATNSKPLSNKEFLKKYSSHGKFAVRTKFGDDPVSDEYFISSRSLFACGSAQSGTDLIRDLIQYSSADPNNIVVWDAGGGISHTPEPDETGAPVVDITGAAIMTTDLADFHRELSALLGRPKDSESVVVVDSLDPLLSDSSPVADEVISLLIGALREGRQARISVYVSNQRILAGSDHPLVQHLLSASQFVLMGPARPEMHHSHEDLAKLPDMVSGWLMTGNGSAMWRAKVPS